MFLKSNFSIRRKIKIILGVPLFILGVYINGVVDLSGRIFHQPLLYLLTGIIGTYLVLDFSQFLYGKVRSFLSEVGKKSLMIMGTHQHVMLIANCCIGSVYTLTMQFILLGIVFLYELLLMVIIQYNKKFLRMLLKK